MPESKANISQQEYLKYTSSVDGNLFLYGDHSFPDDEEEGDAINLLFMQKYWDEIVAVIHSCTLAAQALTEEYY